MTPEKKDQIRELLDDLYNEAEDILVYDSAEAAKSAIVTAARILALLEETE